MTRPITASLLFLAAFVAFHAFGSTAHACGGFFCNNAQPVNQSAERIIFAQNPDGTTTAVIQIQYSGPSESFAWMLPVVGNPEISVSSNIAFQRLQQQTEPAYRLEVEVEGVCGVRPRPDSGYGPDASFHSDAAFNDSASAPPVAVVNQGSVGPYDFVIVSVDPGATDIARVATEWLNDNGYDVSELGRDRLVPYLESGMNLLAFRLTKGRDAGEIRPVMLGFGTGLPSIPLRPTAAAATPDMGIMVFVLGPARAIPANYLDLELNEARLNWYNYFDNYNALVTLAANEAGGQGFVTEFSDRAAPVGNLLFRGGELASWRAIAELDTDFDQLADTAFLFRGWDGLLEAFLAELTKPAEASEERWVRDPLTTLLDYVPTLRETGELEGFDFARFAARIEADVIDPVRDTAALFDGGRTLTRMYTTMSPDEMTVDPVFDFNPDLGSYSNIHTARQVVECSSRFYRDQAPWRVLLDDGVVVRGSGYDWPLASTDALPAIRKSRRLGTTGQGEVIVDNAAVIDSVVQRNNAQAELVSRRAAAANEELTSPGGASGGGCSASTPSGRSSASWTLLLIGLAFLRRRR